MRKAGRASQTKKENNGLVVVAVDADKSSQHALKWAADHLISKNEIFHLLHVRRKISNFSTPSGQILPVNDVGDDAASTFYLQLDTQTKELLLPFQCFCSRRGLQCKEVILEETDISKAIVDYLVHQSVDNLVLGASSRNAFTRTFRQADIPTSVSKLAPGFCSIYVISKGKVSSLRPAPKSNKHPINRQTDHKSEAVGAYQSAKSDPVPWQPTEEYPKFLASMNNESNDITRSIYQGGAHYSDFSNVSMSSCPSPSRKSSERLFSSLEHDHLDGTSHEVRMSNLCEDHVKHQDANRSGGFNCSSGPVSGAHESCSRYASARQESRRSGLSPLPSQSYQGGYLPSQANSSVGGYSLPQSRLREGGFTSQSELYKIEYSPAVLSNEGCDQRSSGSLDQMPCPWRISGEWKAVVEAPNKMPEYHRGEMSAINFSGGLDRNGAEQKPLQEVRKIVDTVPANVKYRVYSIEEIEKATDNFSNALKIGEGGYGPVFKSTLDHTLVAIKVLQSDEAQGMKQFNQEVEVLSMIRHPNMVLLLGACPEYGCLVYEYMSNGSLEDRLFCRNNTPPLSWQLRFKIAAEIATALLFLHQNKPEPLVHRDLKPGNILLDHNFVSKIADVGLARLVPPSIADAITQYHMTAAAGTFCYIDPEYQKTGLLGIKSDIYALGIILLQLITARPPMGLAHNVEDAIESGCFENMLDPTVPDWPIEETLIFAKLSLKCAELRRKDRPDLGSVVLPELNRLRSMANEMLPNAKHFQHATTWHRQNPISIPSEDGSIFLSDNDMSKAYPASMA